MTEPGKEHKGPCELKSLSRHDRNDPIIFAQLHRTSQPPHDPHLGLGSSLLWGTGLCIVGCVGSSLSSTHQMPVVLPHPSCYNLECPQTLTDVSGGVKLTHS